MEETLANAESASKVLAPNCEWLANRRAELKRLAEEARAARKDAAKALHKRRSDVAHANLAKIRERKATKPPTERELRHEAAKTARRKKQQAKWNKAWRRRKRAADPEHQRKRRNRNQRRWARRARKRLISERYQAKREQAGLRREAKAERRRIREERAAQRAAIELCEGDKKKPTRLEAEYARGFREGYDECLRVLTTTT